MGASGMIPEIVPLDVTTGLEPQATLGWVPVPVVSPNMVMICGEGGLESDEELNELIWSPITCSFTLQFAKPLQ